MKNSKKLVRRIIVALCCMMLVFGTATVTSNATTVTQTKYAAFIKGTMTFDFVPTSLQVSGARNMSVAQYQYFATQSYYNTYRSAQKVRPVEYHMYTEGKMTEPDGARYTYTWTFTGYQA